MNVLKNTWTDVTERIHDASQNAAKSIAQMRKRPKTTEALKGTLWVAEKATSVTNLTLTRASELVSTVMAIDTLFYVTGTTSLLKTVALCDKPLPLALSLPQRVLFFLHPRGYARADCANKTSTERATFIRPREALALPVLIAVTAGARLALNRLEKMLHSWRLSVKP